MSARRNPAVITTKIQVPPLRANAVARPRVRARIAEALHPGAKLLLLSAPAGYGKTTALLDLGSGHAQSHEAERQIPDARYPPPALAWLSLDEEDDEPVRFFTYLAAALHRAGEPVGGGVLAALEASPPPALRPLLAELLNEVAASPHRLMLVLDDYHVVTHPAIHELVTLFLDHQPENLRLAIATRADPPLPLAQLRARDQLVELRQADLCFNESEAAAFLAHTMALDLDAGDAAALTERTEGWAAGLQLAALSLRDAADPAAAIRSLSGTHRFILDYLVTQVLDLQPEQVQGFLLAMSILDRLSTSLCEAVLGDWVLDTGYSREYPISNIQYPASSTQYPNILAYLESANLFLTPLDVERRWYRLHPLFRDLLRRRLEEQHPKLVPLLHGRASRWYEAQGDVGEAIDHALAAGDGERAADLVEAAAEAVLARAETARLVRWLEALPAGVVRRRATLSLYYAWAIFLSGGTQIDVAAHLADAEAAPDAGPGQSSPLRSLLNLFRGQPERGAELARAALEALPGGHFMRGVAAWNLALAQFLMGDLDAGIDTSIQAADMGLATGNVLIAAVALSQLAEVRGSQGYLCEAQRTYRHVLDLITDDAGRRLPVAGLALIGLGEIEREMDDLDTAERHLRDGLALAHEWSEITAFDGYTSLARVRQARGDSAAASHFLDRARHLTRRFDVSDYDDAQVAAVGARLALIQARADPAQYADAERWAAGAMAAGEGGAIEYLRAIERLVLARVQLVRRRPAEALDTLAPLLPGAGLLRSKEVAGRPPLFPVDTLTVHALALYALGRLPAALDALDRALGMAAVEGHVRTFLDEGPPMARLLAEYVAHAARHEGPPSSAAQLAGRLLARFGHETPATGEPAAAVEPLSPRELEILRFLAGPLTTTEIAATLGVAPSTVRSHVKTIYAKLDAHGRADAVARAKELGIPSIV